MYSPYSAPPPSYAPPPQRRGIPVWVWILGAALLFGLTTCGGLVAFCVHAQNHPGGVVMGTQATKADRVKLREKKALTERETLVAFYDATMSQDFSEVYVVTTERVAVAKAGEVSALDLKDLTTIDHRDEGALGDIIDVATAKGERLHIEIAPLNGGVSFLNALEDETKKKSPSVVVHRAEAR